LTGAIAVCTEFHEHAGALMNAATLAAQAATATTGDPYVSIVMPCLNEEQTVAVCVRKAVGWLERAGLHGEVIVVDNGSSDRSVELATEAGARVVHERRRGYGQTYLRGFTEARGEFIVMGDSDDTYDFSDLSALIEPLKHGADMVVGNRFSGGISQGAMPWAHRYIGSPIINFVIRLFFGTRIGDSQSGLRAFRRSVPERLQLRSGGMELASEMIVSAARAGMTITEVPAPYAVRQGESKLNTVRDGWRHIRYLLIAAPDFLFTLPGIVMVALGIVTSVISFVSPAGVEIGSVSWQPVFAGTILLAIGVNSVLVGVVAKLYGATHGHRTQDRWVQLYRRWFHLEWVLALAAAVFGSGLLIDGFLFVVWASGSQVAMGGQLAALAQTLLIVGAELGMAGFLIVTIESP
jgi:glycosyltransferase involved in cell wall biosynthesis